MGWSIGFDSTWNRDIGYGVPATCDHPGCGEVIDRGLSFVCGEEPYGGERGCGLFFCDKHLLWSERLPRLCSRCKNRCKPFTATPDRPEWIKWKLTDSSWKEWRAENKALVKQLRQAINNPGPTSTGVSRSSQGG